MVRTVLFVILGVSGGLALATLFQGRAIERLELPEARSTAEATGVSPSVGPLEDRLNLLEAALREEVAHRTVLQAEVAALNNELDALREGRTADRDRSLEETNPAAPGEVRARFAERFSNARNGDPTQRRLGQLTQAGFSPDEAQRIMQRESELRMAALNEQYEANRQGEPFDRSANWSVGLAQLRQELGEADYERYLVATGQSTSVPVRQVLASSPAEVAGLQRGDQIVGYAGERVFSTADLNRLTLEGEPGETVAIDVIRDGQPTQVFVPRGPIGITGGRGSGGRAR